MTSHLVTTHGKTVPDRLNDELVRIALQRYSDGEVGMRGAAEIAGCTGAEMMREASERGVVSNYGPADLESDVDALL